MLWITPPFIIGIAVAQALGFSWVSASIVFLIAVLGVCLKRSIITASVFIFGFGAVHYVVNSPPEITQNLATEWSVESLGGNDGKLIAYRDHKGEWRECRGAVNIHNGNSFENGDQIVCRAQLKPNPYLCGASTLYVREIIDIKQSSALFSRLGRLSEDRIRALGLSDDVESVGEAQVLGRKSTISAEIETSYQRSGTSHILALSGLHLGVLYSILNALLLWLPLVPRGHLVLNILIIILLWSFALITGCSSSVMRAAWMFTMLQLSKITAKRYDGINLLSAVALIMILFDMDVIYDIGFQLSFISVLAIKVWALPICHKIKSRWWIVEVGACSLIFGVASTVATIPLVGYLFGGVSLLGPITTPPMMFTLTGAVAALLLWLAVPIGFIGGGVAYIVETLLTMQNFLARWVASWGWGYIEVDLSLGDLWFIYALYLIITSGLYHIFSGRRK